MQFSELMRSMTEQAGLWRAAIGDDWAHGRTVFGGVQVALAARAMRALVPAEIPLRTLQTTFVAPVAVGEVSVRARVLRAGRSAIHVEARIGEGDAVQCLVAGVFGASRSSAVVVAPRRPPVDAPAPIDLRFVPGATPNFTQHLPMRWLRGTPPYTGNPSTTAVIEVNLRDDAPMSELHLLAIADAIPPVALSMLGQPAMASSMTWMMEFLAADLRGLALQGWRLDVEVTAASAGYTSQSAMVWAPDGSAAALSRQSMVVFA